MTEWKKVPGWGGKYEASDKGEVRNANTHKRYKTNLNRYGYDTMTVCFEGKSKHMMVHRLVALAFIGPIPEDYEVNHKNGVKDDNRPENLEIVTRSENMKHACQVLGKLSKPVVAIRLSDGKRFHFVSADQCERELGLYREKVRNCMNGYRKTHKGYAFVLDGEHFKQKSELAEAKLTRREQALREKVKEWRETGNGMASTKEFGIAAGLKQCADEIEKILEER